MQLNSSHFGKHPWGERSSLGVQNDPSKRDGKGFLAGKGVGMMLHTLLQSVPLEPLNHLLFLAGTCWNSTCSSLFQRWNPWQWSRMGLSDPLKLYFHPFNRHHFYFANFHGLYSFVSRAPPAARVPHWVDFAVGKKKKSKKRGNATRISIWAAVIVLNCPFSVLCSHSKGRQSHFCFSHKTGTQLRGWGGSTAVVSSLEVPPPAWQAGILGFHNFLNQLLRSFSFPCDFCWMR